MHLLIFDDEAGPSIRIFDRVTGGDYLLPGWSKNTQGSLLVLHLHGVKESATGIFGGSKGPLSRLLGEHWGRRTTQGKYKHYGNCKSNKALAFNLKKNRNLVQHDVLLHFRFLDQLYYGRMRSVMASTAATMQTASMGSPSKA